MQPPPAPCKEREILERRCGADLKLYLSAVKTLEHPVYKRDFDQAYKNADLAKSGFEKAREALNAHLASHGC